MIDVCFFILFIYLIWLQYRNNRTHLFCLKNIDNEFLLSYDRMLFGFKSFDTYLWEAKTRKSKYIIMELSSTMRESNASSETLDDSIGLNKVSNFGGGEPKCGLHDRAKDFENGKTETK